MDNQGEFGSQSLERSKTMIMNLLEQKHITQKDKFE